VVSAAKDKTIRVWDVTTGEELYQYKVLTDVVRSVTFTDDGLRMVVTSESETIVVDVETGEELHRKEGENNVLNSSSYSPDGKRMLTISSDRTIRIWDFPPLQELIDKTRTRFKTRPITDEERRMYYLE
jgi:WD40 repeat protein